MASGFIARYLENGSYRNAPCQNTEHLRSYVLEILMAYPA